MKRFILTVGLCLFLTAGCGPQGERPAPPLPQIKVERAEAPGSGVNVTVRFLNHQSGRDGCYVVLDTPEKLQNYKVQTAFLLSQLEEAEKRMTVNEQPKK